ncbi:MAG TPA: nitrite/sulfite reductase [Longimicrobiales bacterium]|nr:nitrite/sulfite reductase [Longimicrobiales bacterium]
MSTQTESERAGTGRPSYRAWAERLGDRIPDWLGREIDIFETQITLRKRGDVDERLFAETRLRRGVYGQRYDNGQRHDGTQNRQLPYREHPTKGPDTMWDAPGMQRIKIPYGKLTIERMDVLAALAEDYSDGICHVTTRQDIQLHFVHIEDTPDIMRRLAAVNITTREACGNSVRNVTACHLAGVCCTETFDVTPYAEALMRFLLGHPDVQDFGRKFKPAFSGCAHEACGLVNMHDLGLVARTKVVDGELKRGFAYYVGGGLGAIPYEAKLMEEFVPEEELLPLTQAVSRVFARLGEKENRGRARIKFLVAKLGIEEFRRLVLEEREKLPYDPRWTAYLEGLDHYEEKPLKKGVPLETLEGTSPEFRAWYKTNVRKQRQPGYAVATVKLPLGDITSDQMRALADIAAEFVGDNVRTTVEQNIVLRWVSEADLPALHAALVAIDLGDAGAEGIEDVVTCPGTDTCKLGIASSRGLGAELRRQVTAMNGELPEAVKGLRIKASGCFNSCGQHHIADLGFYGISRKKGGRLVPHFQVVLGGKWLENGGSYGLATLAIPSKNIPEVVRRITKRYAAEREPDESFTEFIERLGKAEVKGFLQDLTEVPAYEQDPSYYSDWGDPREYTMDDYGEGECAGMIVPLAEFGLQASEREAFEAQLHFDAGDLVKAKEMAYKAMLTAAKALVKTEFYDITDDPDQIVAEFRKRFHDTKRFHDRFAGAKFAAYLFSAHEAGGNGGRPEQARERVEEAQLFIEAAYACYEKMNASAPAVPA